MLVQLQLRLQQSNIRMARWDAATPVAVRTLEQQYNRELRARIDREIQKYSSDDNDSMDGEHAKILGGFVDQGQLPRPIRRQHDEHICSLRHPILLKRSASVLVGDKSATLNRVVAKIQLLSPPRSLETPIAEKSAVAH